MRIKNYWFSKYYILTFLGWTFIVIAFLISNQNNHNTEAKFLILYLVGLIGLLIAFKSFLKKQATEKAAIIETKATPVIFYCNGVKCDRSVKSAQIALDNGYTNIYWFRGGIEEWRANGFPIEK